MKHREDHAMTKIEHVEHRLTLLNQMLDKDNKTLESWKNNPPPVNSLYLDEGIKTLTEIIEETKLEIEMYNDLLKVYKGQ